MSLILEHPFDHIMPGPYRFVGLQTPEDRESIKAERKSKGLVYTENTRCGGTCAHCGMAISVICVIQGSEGRFKVGSTCVEKLDKSPKLVDTVKRAINQRRANLRREKLRLQYLAVKRWLAENEVTLSQKPHPKGWSNKTLFDYLTWYCQHAGNKKIVEIAKKNGFKE